MVHTLQMSGSEWKSVLNNGESVAGREGGIGRQYFFYLGNNNNANGGYVHHRFKMQVKELESWCYRRLPGFYSEAWTMVTVMNQGNPGVAKTYFNGAPIQTSTVNRYSGCTIRLSNTYIAAYANW